MSIVTTGIDHDRLEMSCPCCGMTYIEPSKNKDCPACVAALYDSGPECTLETHKLVYVWGESPDTVCSACGCVYAVHAVWDDFNGECVMDIEWLCEYDGDRVCSCEKHRKDQGD